MNSYTELLVDYMRQKSVIVKMFSGTHLADDADLADLSLWPESLSHKALSLMSDTTDHACCPWCRTSEFVACNHCAYGERNGVCADDGSLYSRIQDVLQPRYTGLVSLPGMRRLIENTKDKFYALASNSKENTNE
jgi:hypothetical protein